MYITTFLISWFQLHWTCIPKSTLFFWEREKESRESPHSVSKYSVLLTLPAGSSGTCWDVEGQGGGEGAVNDRCLLQEAHTLSYPLKFRLAKCRCDVWSGFCQAGFLPVPLIGCHSGPTHLTSVTWLKLEGNLAESIVAVLKDRLHFEHFVHKGLQPHQAFYGLLSSIPFFVICAAFLYCIYLSCKF